VDPLDIGPEGVQRASSLAAQKNNAMLRLRFAALALVVGAGVFLMWNDAAVHALWVLPTMPLFFSADLRLGGLVESYHSIATQDEHGGSEMASVAEILRGGYRNEYYGLLAAALLAVAIRG
jgi:hypothetical protein